MLNIPQNDNIFFLFLKGKWKNSVDCVIYNHETINYFNLFAIIRHFIDNKKFPLIALLIVSSENDERKELLIYKNVNLIVIKKMNFSEFTTWLDDTISELWKYIKNEKFYGFRFLINPTIPVYDISDTLPQYPWSLEMQALRDSTDNESLISTLKKENENLKIEIKKLLSLLNQLNDKK